jgi:hypothetical protein
MSAFDHLSDAEKKALIIRGRALHSLIQAVNVILSGATTPRQRFIFTNVQGLARELLRDLGEEPPAREADE